MGLKCGVTKQGTDLLDLLRDSEACLIMHSGSNDVDDRDRYSIHGCHGVVGKADKFVEKVAQIYLDFLSKK